MFVRLLLEVLGVRRSSEGTRDQPPSLPLIAVLAPARGGVQGDSSLLRWLPIEGSSAAGAQAILPSIPTLKYAVTAQASRRPRIHRGLFGLLPSVPRALTHACSPRYTGEAGCDRLLEAHARGRPKDSCLPQAHAPELPRAWNHPHNCQAPQPRATSLQPPTPPTAPQLGLGWRPQSLQHGIGVWRLAC